MAPSIFSFLMIKMNEKGLVSESSYSVPVISRSLKSKLKEISH